MVLSLKMARSLNVVLFDVMAHSRFDVSVFVLGSLLPVDSVSWIDSLVAFVLSVDMARSPGMVLSACMARSWHMVLLATVAMFSVLYGLRDLLKSVTAQEGCDSLTL